MRASSRTTRSCRPRASVPRPTATSASKAAIVVRTRDRRRRGGSCRTAAMSARTGVLPPLSGGENERSTARQCSSYSCSSRGRGPFGRWVRSSLRSASYPRRARTAIFAAHATRPARSAAIDAHFATTTRRAQAVSSASLRTKNRVIRSPISSPSITLAHNRSVAAPADTPLPRTRSESSGVRRSTARTSAPREALRLRVEVPTHVEPSKPRE